MNASSSYVNYMVHNTSRQSTTCSLFHESEETSTTATQLLCVSNKGGYLVADSNAAEAVKKEKQ